MEVTRSPSAELVERSSSSTANWGRRGVLVEDWRPMEALTSAVDVSRSTGPKLIPRHNFRLLLIISLCRYVDQLVQVQAIIPDTHPVVEFKLIQLSIVIHSYPVHKTLTSQFGIIPQKRWRNIDPQRKIR